MSLFEDRIESEASSTQRVTNADLVCKDCIFKLDDSKQLRYTTQCRTFLLKPNKVLKGGNCTAYLQQR